MRACLDDKHAQRWLRLDRKSVAKTPSKSSAPVRSSSASPGIGAREPAPGSAEGLPHIRPAIGLQAPGGIFSLEASASPLIAKKSAQGSARENEADRLAGEGKRLIRAGRLRKAIAVLKRAVELRPGAASCHLDLGYALMASGRVEEAADTLAHAIRLDPRMPTAHSYLAQIFDGFGQEAMAMAGYKAAVALKPDLVDAQMRLGDLYLARDMRVEAATAFRAAATAAALSSETACIAEARGLEASGDFEAALAAVRAAVAAHPESGEARAILANLLTQKGLSAEAAAEFERASELTLDMNSVWIGITINRKITAADDRLIARMTAALEQPKLMPRHRQMLHFALGKAHDDRGEYQAAMRNFEAGNRLRAMGGRFDREGLVRRVDRIIESTRASSFHRLPDWGIGDATPVLIVGMPRSGSTLTEQILSSHPEVAAGAELGFWSAAENQAGDLWNPAPGAARRLADGYLAALRAFGPEAKRVTDKALANFFLLGAIRRIFPKATVVHCRRDPIDTALSIFTTNFETNFDYASDRSDLVFYYRQYQRLMDHWRSVLPPDRFIEVDYETLVADPEPHARRLVAGCGLEWNDACLEPHRNPRRINTASVWQARQPIYRTSVERWRRYEPWLGELRELAPGE